MSGRVRILSLVALALCLCLVLDGHALARPGGGQGYSGPSGGSSSGGGGGGDGDAGAAILLIFELLKIAFVLTSRYPSVMWPIWAVAAGIAVLWMRSLPDPRARDWTVATMKSEEAPPARIAPRVVLEQLREIDPDFSLVLFEDFVYALFARAHEARGRGRLADLGAYLVPAAQRGLVEMSPRGLEAVEGIVIGTLRYERVRGATAGGDASRVLVELDIEANYTERTTGSGTSWWARERWTLSRPRSARSLPPERMRSIGCPGCGAPVASRDAGVCAHCGTTIAPSDFDWIVDRVALIERRQAPPALTGDTEEAGTTLPTIVDPMAQARLKEIEARDPQFTWPAFEARVRHIFAELQPAWSGLDDASIRLYLSDRLQQAWTFWFAAYRRSGLRNVTEGTTVSGIELVRVVSDKYFDAITVRVRARGLDYTVDEAGQLRAGSREQPRAYTEYWTLVRGRAAAGAPRADGLCPRCGARLAVTMGGTCEHCGAHVSAGEFDWVLSRIEQDEAYRG